MLVFLQTTFLYRHIIIPRERIVIETVINDQNVDVPDVTDRNVISELSIVVLTADEVKSVLKSLPVGKASGPDGWMDGWVRVLRPFNSISVISRRWKGEHERLCAMKRRLGSGRISPPAGFEPATPWSEVGSASRSATRTLLVQMESVTGF